MRQLPPTHYFLIAMTFLAGIFLTIIPFPQWIIWARPQWIFALTCYWILTSPSQCGLVAAWTAGFLMDLITGTPLGQQAFVFVLLAYFLLKIYPVVSFFLFSFKNISRCCLFSNLAASVIYRLVLCIKWIMSRNDSRLDGTQHAHFAAFHFCYDNRVNLANDGVDIKSCETESVYSIRKLCVFSGLFSPAQSFCFLCLPPYPAVLFYV